MRSFKKAALSAVCFALMFALLSGAVIGLYYHTELAYFRDGGLRASLAGTVDTEIIGSSQAWDGVDPRVLDARMGVVSYNLSGGVIPMYAKALLLEKELNRNPVKTVLIEIASDTMTRDNAKDYAEGDEMILARLDTWRERLDYARRFLRPEDCVNVFSRALVRGAQCWVALLHGGGGVPYENKGFNPRETNDVRIPAERLSELYRSRSFTTDEYREENIAGLLDLIRLCQAHGAEPVLIALPVSEHENWELDGLDRFDAWTRALCEREGCRFYDFNLLKDRFLLFSDERSFFDACHLSETGAEALSESLAALLTRTEAGEDTAALFYAGQEEMLSDSSCMRQYQELLAKEERNA